MALRIGIPKETKERENRVAMTPDVAGQLVKAGFEVVIEKGAGENSYFSDEAYTKSGANVSKGRNEIFSTSDVILQVNAPALNDIALMKRDAILISLMFALTEPALVEACAKQGISSFSMDAIPRISRAQKMDVLSSQSNLAGYKTVLLAANALGKIFPLM